MGFSDRFNTIIKPCITMPLKRIIIQLLGDFSTDEDVQDFVSMMLSLSLDLNCVFGGKPLIFSYYTLFAIPCFCAVFWTFWCSVAHETLFPAVASSSLHRPLSIEPSWQFKRISVVNNEAFCASEVLRNTSTIESEKKKRNQIKFCSFEVYFKPA